MKLIVLFQRQCSPVVEVVGKILQVDTLGCLLRSSRSNNRNGYLTSTNLPQELVGGDG
jgi:hypothetical protein